VNITDKDEKKILEKDSKHVECGESVGEPKLKDNHRLIFDQRKLIKSRDIISDIYYDEVRAKI
ncbi:32294_t:CDS:1, partial [Racocetra persica]